MFEKISVEEQHNGLLSYLPSSLWQPYLALWKLNFYLPCLVAAFIGWTCLCFKGNLISNANMATFPNNIKASQLQSICTEAELTLVYGVQIDWYKQMKLEMSEINV